MKVEEIVTLAGAIPLGKIAFVKELDLKRVTESGLDIPDVESMNTYFCGEVIKASPDCRYLQAGHNVMFDKRNASVITIEGKTYYMSDEDRDVKCILNADDEAMVDKMADMRKAERIIGTAMVNIAPKAAEELARLLAKARME